MPPVGCSSNGQGRPVNPFTNSAADPLGFRDLSGAVVRMATLASGWRITVEIVEEEIARLRAAWAPHREPSPGEEDGESLLAEALGPEKVQTLDLFDRVQLAAVLEVCRRSRSLSEAGRALVAVSRTVKKSANDANRLGKYLARFGLTWPMVCR